MRSVDLLDKLGVLEIEILKPARISIDQDHIERSDPVFAIPQQEFRAPIQTFLNTLTSRIHDSEEIDKLVGIVFGSVIVTFGGDNEWFTGAGRATSTRTASTSRPLVRRRGELLPMNTPGSVVRTTVTGAVNYLAQRSGDPRFVETGVFVPSVRSDRSSRS